MKVAVFGLRGFPNVQGGVEKHSEELYPHMASKDLKILVYRRKPYVKPRKNYKGVRFKDIWTVRNKFLETPIHGFLCALHCLMERPAVVQVHNSSSGAALLITKLFGMKAVVTYHTANYEQDKWNWFAKQYIRLCEKIAFRIADRIIFVSDYYYKKFPGVRAKSLVIPNGPTDFDRYASGLKIGDLGLKVKGYFMYMGRISPEKRLHDLVEAFSRLDTEKKLVIVGSYDTDRNYFEKLKRYEKKLGGRLVMPGYKPSGDIKVLLENAYSYVLPSANEAMPIALLEAMSLGICPIASDLQPNKDIVREDGLIFKVGDVDELASTLDYAIRNPEKIRALGLSGKKRVTKEYDWKKIAKKTADVLRSCIRT